MIGWATCKIELSSLGMVDLIYIVSGSIVVVVDCEH